MAVTLFSKSIGLIREIIFSALYGTSNTADAYLFSLTVATIIFGFLGSGITTSFIPVYQQVIREKGKEKGVEFVNIVCTFLVILGIIVILFLLPNTEFIVKFLANGFSAETSKLAAKFCKFSILTIIFTSMIGIYSGVLQVHSKFIVPALIGIPLNITLIIFFVVSIYHGEVFLGIGNMLAVASQLILLVPFLYKEKYRIKPTFSFRNIYFNNLIKISFPIILSASVNQINVLVDKALASYTSGGVSSLNYAHTIITIINDVIISAIVTSSYPQLAEKYAANDRKAATRVFSEVCNTTLFLLIPSAIGLALFSENVISVFYQRGAFTRESVKMCADILMLYAIGVPFVGIRQILIRAFYAMQDTKTPVINMSLALGIKIILNIPLEKFLGIKGLAFATSISSILSAIFLFISYIKKHKGYKVNFDIKEKVKIIICSIMMGTMCIAIKRVSEIYFSDFGILVTAIIGGVISYYFLGRLLKVNEMKAIMKELKRR